MKSGVVVLAVFLLLFAPADSYGKRKAEEKNKPDLQPGIRAEEGERFRRVDAVLEGRLAGYALPRSGDGGRELYLLVMPVEEERDEERETRTLPPCRPADRVGRGAVFRMNLRDRPDLERLSGEIPLDAGALDAQDLDGDGDDEILLFRDGEVLTPGRDNSWRQLHAGSAINHRGMRPTVVRFPVLGNAPWLPVNGPGMLRLYGPGSAEESWGVRHAMELPVGVHLGSAN